MAQVWVHTTWFRGGLTPHGSGVGSHHMAHVRVHTGCVLCGFTPHGSGVGSHQVRFVRVHTSWLRCGFTPHGSGVGSHHMAHVWVHTTWFRGGLTPHDSGVGSHHMAHVRFHTGCVLCGFTPHGSGVGSHRVRFAWVHTGCFLIGSQFLRHTKCTYIWVHTTRVSSHWMTSGVTLDLSHVGRFTQDVSIVGSHWMTQGRVHTEGVGLYQKLRARRCCTNAWALYSSGCVAGQRASLAVPVCSRRIRCVMKMCSTWCRTPSKLPQPRGVHRAKLDALCSAYGCELALF